MDQFLKEDLTGRRERAQKPAGGRLIPLNCFSLGVIETWTLPVPTHAGFY